MDRMGDAWTGAKTDITYNAQMGCTDDAWTGAPKGVMYNALTDGDLTEINPSRRGE